MSKPHETIAAVLTLSKKSLFTSVLAVFEIINRQCSCCLEKKYARKYSDLRCIAEDMSRQLILLESRGRALNGP